MHHYYHVQVRTLPERKEFLSAGCNGAVVKETGVCKHRAIRKRTCVIRGGQVQCLSLAPSGLGKLAKVDGQDCACLQRHLEPLKEASKSVFNVQTCSFLACLCQEAQPASSFCMSSPIKIKVILVLSSSLSR